MKFATTVALLGSALLNGVTAYPQIATQVMEARAAEVAAEAEAVDLESRQINPPPFTPPVFNAKFQYVSKSGKYKFVAPGPTDQRGRSLHL